MKAKFAWYVPLSDGEIEEIWRNGLLTVDANVLLDLYRYHENTRESLISSLELFEGRLWLSHQASSEFIRNRANVIVSAAKAFERAAEEVSKLRKHTQSAVEQLTGNRIVPQELVTGLAENITTALDQVATKLSTARSEYPNYLSSDPIFDRLLRMFDGAVGAGFAADDMEALRKEGEDRKLNKVPPGYFDDDKDDDRPYGDFYLWRQILLQAKAEKKPVIVVTSERKEDWWEIHAGRTIGPRQELLKEAFDFSGQRILIYQTERFLEFSARRAGGSIDENTVKEIQEVGSRARKAGIVHLDKQGIVDSTDTLNSGTLVTTISKPTYGFTVTGHLDPPMAQAPQVTVELAKSPPSTPEYRLSASTGTTFDFNVHIGSKEHGVQLPAGEYLINYVAKADGNAESEDRI